MNVVLFSFVEIADSFSVLSLGSRSNDDSNASTYSWDAPNAMG